MITPAQLRERIRIDRKAADATDDYGNPTPGDWETLIAAQPARIMPVRGGEQVLADRLTGTVVYEITLRESAANRGISAGDRAMNPRTGEAFNIKHPPVNPDERGRFLTFQVEAGTAI